MDIDATKCVGCGNCHIICAMGVISLDADGKSVVNQDECSAILPLSIREPASPAGPRRF
ncbi:MAG: 4Fe-4S binding protein [Proteobacteria bacterium]|nr:4Fe-4S binding protein [Pseudomonadota bacterium]MBU1744326.1 4Fe-4S binding protein [Pseudomonadota bacterium]MBU1964513.1 4Fe-4S binding protein [Pseudomonadota bacterium]